MLHCAARCVILRCLDLFLGALQDAMSWSIFANCYLQIVHVKLYLLYLNIQHYQRFIASSKMCLVSFVYNPPLPLSVVTCFGVAPFHQDRLAELKVFRTGLDWWVGAVQGNTPRHSCWFDLILIYYSDFFSCFFFGGGHFQSTYTYRYLHYAEEVSKNAVEP